VSERHRYEPTRTAIPEGHSVVTLCTCCTGRAVTFDGLWAKCKRCDQDCANQGCRDLMPTRRGIYGRFTRLIRPRLFR